jgi:hypothetical protein
MHERRELAYIFFGGRLSLELAQSEVEDEPVEKLLVQFL